MDKATRRQHAIAARLARCYQGVEVEDILTVLRRAAALADERYDPQFGMTLEQYRALCQWNAIHKLCANLKRRDHELRLTDWLDKPIDLETDTTFGDLLCDARNSVRRTRQLTMLHLALEQLKGIEWLVVNARLYGNTATTIAHKLSIPRTTFDRQFAPVFAKLLAEVHHA